MQHKTCLLRLHFDRDFIAEIPINRSPFTIGRKTGCELRLIEQSVSREHCRIFLKAPGEVFLEDVSSTNGTYLNHARVLRTRLKPGDVVTLGKMNLIFAEIPLEQLKENNRSIWNRLGLKKQDLRFSPPVGPYRLAENDLITEFNSISYAMVEHAKIADDETPKDLKNFLKVSPRLSVIARKEYSDDEPTKFSVSESALEGIASIPLHEAKPTEAVFVQPKVKKPWFKVPWKIVEFVLIPLMLIIGGTILAKYLLGYKIESQFELAEKHWNEKLNQVAARYQYAQDIAFSKDESLSESAQAARRDAPLPESEVWRRIDARPSLRNFLLFEILDDFLAQENKAWSLDEALKNLSKMQSVTSRLPSVRKMQVVLSMADAPFDMQGLVKGKVFFLSDTEKTTDRMSYAEYKSEMTPRLQIVSGCASVRQSVAPGKVVLAFTVNKAGKTSSVFINKARSSHEHALWDCVEKKLKSIEFGPPPGGSLSIVYTFAFAGTQKVTF